MASWARARIDQRRRPAGRPNRGPFIRSLAYGDSYFYGMRPDRQIMWTPIDMVLIEDMDAREVWTTRGTGPAAAGRYWN